MEGDGTDDAFAAYRRVTSANPAYTVIMIAVPTPDGSFVDKCFCLPCHDFGLTSAVLNFNCVPEPLLCFSRGFFGVPASPFYDDEGEHEPSYAAGSQASYATSNCVRSLGFTSTLANMCLGSVIRCMGVFARTGLMTMKARYAWVLHLSAVRKFLRLRFPILMPAS